jgi:hydrogenase maturation protease
MFPNLTNVAPGPLVQVDDKPAGESIGSGTLILAFGNALRGDDGFGPVVLEALEEADRLPSNVCIADGDSYGLLTAILTGEYRRVIIVDAVDMGRSPGEWIRFRPEDTSFLPVEINSRTTLHNANVVEALELGNALGLELPEIVIYGVQPQDLGWTHGLSDPVQMAVMQVCEAISSEIK